MRLSYDIGAWSGMIGGAVVALMIGPGAMASNPATVGTPPTFAKDVAPILQARCLGCHRKGQVGPFALETYEQARKRSQDIAAVVEDRLMPPWKAEAGVGPKLKHDPTLTPSEVATLRAWADADAPRGDLGEMPEAPGVSDGWQLGTPDLVLEPSEDFVIAAAGPDTYRCFVIPTNLPSDVYLTGIEFRPGNRRAVHHMSTYIDTKGFGRHLDAADPGPGYTSFAGPGFKVYGELGFWNAGGVPARLPNGLGLFLPGGSDVILQVHYHPSGKPETDRSQLGLHFARKPVERALHWSDASNFDFKLPAGEANIEVVASWFVRVDLEAFAVAPHMHQLGKDMRMTVTTPDGRTRDLINVPEWDPSWQGTYHFEKPVPLPRGSLVKVIAHFDNSAHPRNPHSPPQTVQSGYGVTDEMCVGYIAVAKKDQDLTRPGARDDLYQTLERQRLQSLLKRLPAQARKRF